MTHVISIKTNRAVGGEGMRWGSLLRCRCWDCGAIRRSFLRRALQVLAVVALAGVLRQLLAFEVAAVRRAGPAGSPSAVTRVM